jgi:hypothetical protein
VDKTNRQQHRLDTRDCLPHLLNELGLTGHGVEIGVYRGEYSKILAERWHGEKLWLVDPWTHFDPVPSGAEWWEYPPPYLEAPWTPTTDRTERAGVNRSDVGHRANMAATRENVADWLLTNKVEMKRQTSQQAARCVEDDSLSFVYLDGNHTYEAVRQDIHCWYRKVKPGGIIGGHDYSDVRWSHRGAWNRVKEAVDLYADKLGWELFFTDTPSAHSEVHVGTISWFAVKV